jgi:hypothetical protein
MIWQLSRSRWGGGEGGEARQGNLEKETPIGSFACGGHIRIDKCVFGSSSEETLKILRP